MSRSGAALGVMLCLSHSTVSGGMFLFSASVCCLAGHDALSLGFEINTPIVT